MVQTVPAFRSSCRKPDVNNYRQMIAQKAWAVWRKLPAQHKSWIGVEDLIQDGILFARFSALPHYRPHRANFTTFLSFALENFYRGILFDLLRMKRNDCRTVPVESVQFLLGYKDDVVIKEVNAVEGLLRIASVASPLLRRYLRRWLLFHSPVHCRGNHFTVARNEMRVLCRKYHFDREDFEYLLRNESWRTSVQVVQKLL